MIKIGLIREGKIPADNRVALTPAQCKWIHNNFDLLKLLRKAQQHAASATGNINGRR